MADTGRKEAWGMIGLSQTRANRTFSSGSNIGNNVNLLELSYNQTTKTVRSQTNVSLSFAGNFRPNPTGSVDNAQPGRFDLNVKRQIKITPKWQVLTRGLGVLSLDPLPDSQKLVLGGYSSIRGFAASEVNGDSGFLFSAESRHRINPTWQFYYYTDYGCTRAISKSVSNTLFSAGLGVGATLSSGSGISLDWAFPLNDHIVKDGRQGGRLWVNYVTPIGKL
jgi:hemolysin activation/secretion protein